MTIVIDCHGTKIEIHQTRTDGVITALMVGGKPVDLTANPHNIQHEDVDAVFTDLRQLLHKLGLL